MNWKAIKGFLKLYREKTGKYNAILLFGPPGVGKGTHGKKIGELEKYFHFSTGDMFRNVDTSTEIGAAVKSYMDRGELVPDDLTFKLFDVTVQKDVHDSRYNPQTQFLLLDGIPRSVEQVPLIDQREDVRQILYLDAPDSVLIERIRHRAIEEGRPEDQDPEVIQKRLDVYREKTLPVLGQYDPALIVKIDASVNVDEIYQCILQKLIR